MSRFKITTTPSGKCDITLTMFDKNNTMVAQRHSTYDVKPTIKELLTYSKTYKQHGAESVTITSTPSCYAKTYRI